MAAASGESVNDIIERIFSLYKQNGGSEEKDPNFWLIVAMSQIKEAKDDIKSGNLDHMAKEFADLAFVAIDGLRKMGFDAIKVMNERLDENVKKDLSGRTKEWYLAKLNGKEPA